MTADLRIFMEGCKTMPDFPIIDSHVHLYDVNQLRYGWMAGAPTLASTHEMSEFDQARGNTEVDGLVFVEVDVDAGLHIEEARYVAGLADQDKRIKAIVAHVPVHKGAAIEADLTKLVAIKGVKGVRRLIQQEADPNIILSDGFLAGVRLLAKYGLSFDICIRHWQIQYAIELVRKCPDVAFIFDHIGKPDIRNGFFEPWASQLKELSRLPNVVCKLSGVVTEADHKVWTRNQVRPYMYHVLDVFGFDRVMFGSDWTVCTLATDYPAWIDVVDEATKNASIDERRNLWRDTAIRTYRLGI